MIFKCYVCSKLKLKKKDSYKIVLRGTGYEITKYMCNSCGDQIDNVYSQGEAIAGTELDD